MTVPRPNRLDERYGRTPGRRRRGRLIAVAAAALAAAGTLAWALWTGLGGATTTMEADTIAATVRSDRVTEVRWLVTGRPSAALVCAVEARDLQGAVVGLAEVTVPATGSANRAGDTFVRTVRRATTGLIASCRDA